MFIQSIDRLGLRDSCRACMIAGSCLAIMRQHIALRIIYGFYLQNEHIYIYDEYHQKRSGGGEYLYFFIRLRRDDIITFCIVCDFGRDAHLR